MSWPSRNLGCCFDPSKDPGKVAIIDLRQPDRPEEVTYAALDVACDAVARGLLAKGLKQGDRIGIMSVNSVPMIAAYLGIMRAGMVAVPISFKLAQETVEYIIKDADLRAVFHDHARVSLVPNHMLGIDFDITGGYPALLDYGPFAAFEPHGREIATILYTSGSTGMPKGVLLSHQSQMWALDAAARGPDRSSHRYIVAAPMFHMNATISVKTALQAGASMVLLPTFDARLYAQAIAKYRVTWLTSVPTMLAMLARERDLVATLDFSSVTNVMMGSAPLTRALVEKVQGVFPDAAISNAYGTTEGGPGLFGPHPEGLPRPATALGYPVPGALTELREGPSPDEGVLYMKSPMLMEGYNNRPEKTAEVMRGGWYRSGDIMRRDENGFFHFLGRADDMFVVGGENVWPGEVEKLVERMPGVHQAAVVPVPDEIKGMLPFAFIVLQDGSRIDEAAIKKFTIDNGPAYAHPRFIEFRSTIPLSATNKPDRRLLIQEAEQIAGRRRAAGERA
jgi:acyl-CoA synthetase (AMP-forming)/AMP-acid ligase II